MIAIEILNIIAINLVARIIFDISASFSIFYFILSVFQLLHISWDFYHPDDDWGKVPRVPNNEILGSQDHDRQSSSGSFVNKFKAEGMNNLRDRLNVWFWLGILLIILFVVIFPLLHI